MTTQDSTQFLRLCLDDLSPYSTHDTNRAHNATAIVSVAGSDCSGGAGLQADLKTFAAHGLYGMSIVLSIVAENTRRVLRCFDVPSEEIFAQFEAVFEDITPQAMKIGMLGSPAILESVEQNLSRYKPSNIVIDPVMFAKGGYPLMPQSLRKRFATMLLPYARILTPNIPEASELCGFAIQSIDDMKDAARALCDMGAKSVLVKGGHRADNASDVLYSDGKFFVLEAPRIHTKNTHGTGCTLSSAIASHLALGYDVVESTLRAKAYVFGAISNALPIGKGYGPTNHLYNLTTLHKLARFATISHKGESK